MAQAPQPKPSRGTSTFVAAALIPSTLVMFAILAGIFYFAWSAGWLVGLVFTIVNVVLWLVIGILTAQRVRKIRAAQGRD